DAELGVEAVLGDEVRVAAFAARVDHIKFVRIRQAERGPDLTPRVNAVWHRVAAGDVPDGLLLPVRWHVVAHAGGKTEPAHVETHLREWGVDLLALLTDQEDGVHSVVLLEVVA